MRGVLISIVLYGSLFLIFMAGFNFKDIFNKFKKKNEDPCKNGHAIVEYGKSWSYSPSNKDGYIKEELFHIGHCKYCGKTMTLNLSTDLINEKEKDKRIEYLKSKGFNEQFIIRKEMYKDLYKSSEFID